MEINGTLTRGGGGVVPKGSIALKIHNTGTLLRIVSIQKHDGRVLLDLAMKGPRTPRPLPRGAVQIRGKLFIAFL